MKHLTLSTVGLTLIALCHVAHTHAKTIPTQTLRSRVGIDLEEQDELEQDEQDKLIIDMNINNDNTNSITFNSNLLPQENQAQFAAWLEIQDTKNGMENEENELEENGPAFSENEDETELWKEVVNDLTLASLPNLIWGGNDDAYKARKLVAHSDFGVMSTVAKHGVPFGNVISYSDGSGKDANSTTGVPYFMLTMMDPTANHLQKNSKASFTISGKNDKKDGGCRDIDAQEPICPKLTLIGTVSKVKGPIETSHARAALIARHPAMAHWPARHGFGIYKMHIESIFFLNAYGGAKMIVVKKYLHVKI